MKGLARTRQEGASVIILAGRMPAEDGAPSVGEARLRLLIRLLRLQIVLQQRLEEKKIRLRKALRRREGQRQVFHGFLALQARGLARHVSPDSFAARFTKLKMTRVPKMLLRQPRLRAGGASD